MEFGDAFGFLIDFLRGRKPRAEVSLWGVIDGYISKYESGQMQRIDGRRQELSPVFLEAAWELAVLGVLRAGAKDIPPAEKFDGTRYYLTEFGARWLSEGEEDAFVPVGSETFVTLLEPFQELGTAFIERARESARCWKAKAYLACCVMCGAAAEAVLLAVAILKAGDEPKILAMYNGKNGRKRLENFVAGSIREELKSTLQPLFGLVKYWRDEAGHGAASSIRQAEARTAMQTLFLYAKFVHLNWSELTKP